MSTTDDFYSAPNIESASRRRTSPLMLFVCFILALVMAPFVMGVLLVFLMLCSIDSQHTDGPAPDASYAIRRAWGEEKLQHHFKAAEEWVHTSTLIAKHVGSIKGVAPIGSPNRFAASFGESWAAMNLQVIGAKGEGVLHLPDFCADDSRQIYGFDTGSWRFEDRHYPVFPSGKSWLQQQGIDSHYDQIFVFAEKQDHRNVVKTCRALEEILQAREAAGTLSRPGGNIFSSFPTVYRSKLWKQFGDSLVELSKETESANK